MKSKLNKALTLLFASTVIAYAGCKDNPDPTATLVATQTSIPATSTLEAMTQTATATVIPTPVSASPTPNPTATNVPIPTTVPLPDTPTPTTIVSYPTNTPTIQVPTNTPTPTAADPTATSTNIPMADLELEIKKLYSAAGDVLLTNRETWIDYNVLDNLIGKVNGYRIEAYEDGELLYSNTHTLEERSEENPNTLKLPANKMEEGQNTITLKLIYNGIEETYEISGNWLAPTPTPNIPNTATPTTPPNYGGGGNPATATPTLPPNTPTAVPPTETPTIIPPTHTPTAIPVTVTPTPPKQNPTTPPLP